MVCANALLDWHLYVVSNLLWAVSIELRIDCSIDLQVIKFLSIATDPLDFVLDGLGDEIDALQHVVDIVNPSLLNL